MAFNILLKDQFTRFVNKLFPIIYAYGTCSTERDVAAKVVTCNGFVLKTGAKVVIRFTDTGSTNPASGNISLNVNGTGAKEVIIGNSNKTVMTYSYGGEFISNKTHEFMFDGTNWVFLGRDTNTTTGTTYAAGSVPANTTFATNGSVKNAYDSLNSNKAAKTEAIKSITRSGTTFTATRCDDTTFTFSQQDNNNKYKYEASSTSTILQFVKDTQAISAFVGFKIKDTANIFGTGANSWIRGFIYYQNGWDSSYTVDGQGFIMKQDANYPTAVRIGGNGSAASNYSISLYAVINNLTSTSTVQPLSAAQGKALNDKLNTFAKLYGRAEPTASADFTISNSSGYPYIMVVHYDGNSSTSQLDDQLIIPKSIWESSAFFKLGFDDKWITFNRTSATTCHCVGRYYGFIEIYGIL